MINPNLEAQVSRRADELVKEWLDNRVDVKEVSEVLGMLLDIQSIRINELHVIHNSSLLEMCKDPKEPWQE